MDKNKYQLLISFEVAKTTVNIYDNKPDKNESVYFQIIEIISDNKSLYLETSDSELYCSFVRLATIENMGEKHNKMDNWNNISMEGK